MLAKAHVRVHAPEQALGLHSGQRCAPYLSARVLLGSSAGSQRSTQCVDAMSQCKHLGQACTNLPHDMSIVDTATNSCGSHRFQAGSSTRADKR